MKYRVSVTFEFENRDGAHTTLELEAGGDQTAARRSVVAAKKRLKPRGHHSVVIVLTRLGRVEEADEPDGEEEA